MNIISNNIISLKFINIINKTLYLSNLIYYIYRPYLLGITNYTLLNTGILAKLSFQNTLKILTTVIITDKTEWKVDIKSNLILSNFIPTGIGWYRYFLYN
ncbi:hypothetical protein BgAZ_600020 (apicoplast) [Babesia gibsoni]|uniref:Uncharacterized protein n=1 Tax=Babesia gibsoni TaxID=33632 RepID=A0AAD8PCN9_BABGI|nr:hypothetical protein BgAZ_600020 [Babesia gibsoni]